MKKTKQLLNFLLLLTLGLCFHTQSAQAIPKAVAFVLKASGDTEFITAKGQDWSPLRKGIRLNSGDRVRTGDNSMVAIVFTDDKSMMKIRSYSDVTIKTRRSRKKLSKRVFAKFGELWFKITSGNSQFALETPTGIAAVKGTEFYALVDKQGNTTIIGIEGIVELITRAGKALLKAGNTGKLASGASPQIGQSDPTQVPDWAGKASDDKLLEMEFQDQNGNKKRLKIKFK